MWYERLYKVLKGYITIAHESRRTRDEKEELRIKSLSDILGPKNLTFIRELKRDLWSRLGYTFFDGISYRKIMPHEIRT